MYVNYNCYIAVLFLNLFIQMEAKLIFITGLIMNVCQNALMSTFTLNQYLKITFFHIKVILNTTFYQTYNFR